MILFRWLLLDRQNAQEIHQLLYQPHQKRPYDTRFVLSLCQFQTMTMYMSPIPIRHLYPSEQRNLALKMIMLPLSQRTFHLKFLQPQHQMHQKLLHQHLGLATLLGDGRKSMTRSSSASSRMPEPVTLGKRSVNDFTVILTAVRLVGIG